MDLNSYQLAALETAIYPEKGKGSALGLAYTALGLTGEAGEYSEKVKKYIRDGYFDPVSAIKELGDVLWYLAAAAYENGMTLEQVAQINLDKLAKRKAENKLNGSGDNR